MAETENELDVAPINIGNINDGAVIEGFNICLQLCNSLAQARAKRSAANSHRSKRRHGRKRAVI